MLASPPDTKQPPAADDLHLAAAALLVHAAAIDGHIDTHEEAMLARITDTHFGLNAEDAAALLKEAKHADAQANDLYRFTAQINAGWQDAHKISLIELLWDIVLADGKIDDFEANLLRRLTALLYVSDKDVALARQRAQKRIQEKEHREKS